MSELDEARKKINAIDEQMAKLFEERMKYSSKIAEYKLQCGLPIYDKTREDEVIERNSSLISDSVIKEFYVPFLKNLMDESKNYQRRLMKGMRVAYSGVPGAFGYSASIRMFNDAELVSYSSFEAAYRAVEKGDCDIAVLPIENSFAGDVGLVMDLVFQGSLYINQIIDFDIVQNLLGIDGASIDDIKTVISHPQALGQCDNYINEHHFEVKEFSNTAVAAKEVSRLQDKSVATIASAEAAKLYNLKIMDKHINTSSNNTTRFAAFSRIINTPNSKIKEGEHFILVFTVINEAGSLAKTLNIIGSHGFNMRNLRSRPMKDLMWNYYFFVEIEGNVNTPDGADMLRELRTVCDRLKLVGTYYSFKEK